MPPEITASKSGSAKTSLVSYGELKRRVAQTIQQGKLRAQEAVEQEKVRTSWEIGKLIVEHILLNRSRAGYGEQVLKRLSADLGISQTELQYMTEFAKTYPIFPSTGKLPWGHYRDLLAVNDAQKREAIARQAAKAKWSQDDLRREIKKIKSPEKSAKQKPITLEPLAFGKPCVYWINEYLGKKYYDLGFSVNIEIKNKVQTTRDEDELYYYNAQVLSVYDGDTFHALIDLGFGIALEQRLRLRRLNASELPSTAGEKAKKVLKKILMKDAGKIQIHTSKTDDQYGRYLVDIWKDGINVDQQLLDSGCFTLREDA